MPVLFAEQKTTPIIRRAYVGDSVWRIAERAQAQYNDPRDIREIVYYIIKDNDLLEGGFLNPGQVLVINVVDNRKAKNAN